MAMNENESKTTVSVGTPKNSGRYPWVQDEGLTEIEAMGNALLELEDELNSVVEDLHRWFGRHGIEELGTMRGDLDHINEVLRPRIECQHSSIKAQYNKKLKQINELANAYASLIGEKVKLHDECNDLQKELNTTKSVLEDVRDDFVVARNMYLRKSEENERLTAKVKEAEDKNLKLVLKKYELETRVHKLESESCIADERNYLQKKLRTAVSELAEMKESFETARKLYLKETEKNEKLAEQVDVRDNHIKELEEALENCEERIYELEEELEYEQDDTAYDRGYRYGSEVLYEALKIMIDMIRRDNDFYEVFDIDESATDDDIVNLFDQMSAEEFLNACQDYRNQIAREIEVGDEIHCHTGSGWCMIVTEIKDKWYKGIITLGQAPVNVSRNSGNYVKTGRHFAYIPLDYDGVAARNKIRKA